MTARHVATALLLIVTASPAAAQGCPADAKPFTVAPVYINAVDGGRALGVAAAVALCNADYDTRPRLPRAVYTALLVDGTVPFASLSLPQNVNAAASVGYTTSLTERTQDDDDDLDAAPSAYRFNYGVLGAGARLLYEADTGFDEQAIAAGVEARWVQPAWRLAPSVVVTLNAVRPIVSEVRDTIGADHDVHGRVGVRLYWLTPLGDRFEAELDGRWFRGFGMDELVADAGLDEGAFLAGRLAVLIGRPLGPVRLDRVFVGYDHGRQPTDAQDRKAWSVGARLSRTGS